jgi:Flp pilus assembly protein TadD
MEGAISTVISSEPGAAPQARAMPKKLAKAYEMHRAGLRARQNGRGRRAVQLLAKAAAAAPEAVDIQCDLGLAYKAEGQFEEAAACLGQVTKLVPQSAEAHSNLGSVFHAWGKPAEALACYEQAVAIKPSDAQIVANLGNALLTLGRYDDAVAAYRRGVACDPHEVKVRANLGVALKEQGQFGAAVEELLATVVRAPTYADAHWNLALVQLMSGDFKNGWFEFEWRRRIPGFTMRHPDGPEWDGTASGTARDTGSDTGSGNPTLLVHAEQGLGDTIQFVRYLHPLMGRANDVVFQCPGALAPLLAGFNELATVVGADRDLPPFDIHAPLMSLPYLLGLEDPYWPEAGAYLAAEPARRARWRDRLDADGGKTFDIAICWQGNPDYRADHRRSPPLNAFEPLAAIDGVRLVSLQKSAAREQIAGQSWAGRILDLGPEIDNDGAFLDSAAILAEADLVITSDTAIPHLAGALGVETWLALPDVPDWRWGTTGDTTPWYPSLRLFRQASTGDWEGVFAALAAELKRRLP